jgi:glucosyl-dolichyl phosphate glucuronosyltransferase
MSSGLASERTHAMKALPRGVVRGVADTIVGGDPSGVIRGLVVVVGLCVTTAGFVTGTVNGHAACFSWARKV